MTRCPSLNNSSDEQGSRCPSLFQNWTSRPPFLQFYILCNTGGPDVGGPDVGGLDVGVQMSGVQMYPPHLPILWYKTLIFASYHHFLLHYFR